MNHNWGRAIASFLVLALIAALCLGCAKEAEEKVVIRVGQITDLTGISSPSLLPLNYAVEDAAKYYNATLGNEVRLQPNDWMEPGYGYWIHATEGCVLVI